MSKDHERRILDQVYGRGAGWTVLATEGPDFLCQRDSTEVLGVEVTEYFHSESDARLQKISAYSQELLVSHRYRHKDDKVTFRVEKITYFPEGDKARGKEIDAIIRSVPSLIERFDKLSSIIKLKNDKCAAYLKSSPVVDLVIYDSNYAFHFERFADLYRPLSTSNIRSQVIASSFREVFLVTKGSNDKLVCVPLKANAFVEEIMICQHLFIAQRHDEYRRLDFGAFMCSLIGLLVYSGFGNTRLYKEDGTVHLRFSSIEFIYGCNGNKIDDYTPFPENYNRGDTIDVLADKLDEEERKRSAQIRESRKGYTSCMDLFFHAHTDL